MIFDGIVQLLVELGLVKKKGKQRLDSTHIVGYVKAMSWMECALETLRFGVGRLAYDAWDEKASRVLESTVGNLCREQSGLAVKQNRAASRHRQCGQDMSDLLEWIDTEVPSSLKREAVKLVRRVFTEQFEVVEGKLELITQRPSRADRTRMIPMPLCR